MDFRRMNDMDIILDEEFRTLLPPLAKDEHETLEKEILDGLHIDNLVVAKINGGTDLVLADGYHRYEICQRHGIPFNTRVKKFADRAAVIQWIIDNQLGRRNLTDERRAYYIGKEYLIDKPPVGSIGKNHELDKVSNLKTAKEIAQKHNTSEKTVYRNAAFAEAVDKLPEPEKEAVLSGQSEMSKSDIAKGKEPILCSRCARVGAIKGCLMCKEARGGSQKKKPRTIKTGDTIQDAAGKEVPPKARKPLADPWMQQTIDFLAITEKSIREQRLADTFNKRKAIYPFVNGKDFIDGIGMVMNTIDQLIEHLKENRPAFICPSCSGEHCPDCRQTGAVSRELKKKLDKK